MLTFKTRKEAEEHVDAGKHVLESDCGLVSDMAKKKSASRVTEVHVASGEAQRISFKQSGPSSTIEGRSEGWALKTAFLHAGQTGREMWPRDMLIRPAVLRTNAVRNFKMAAKIYKNVFEVIEEVTNDENSEAEYSDVESEEEDGLEDIVQCKMTELVDAAVELEPGLQPNSELFKQHAFRLVLPCLQLCANPGIRVDAILKSTITCGSILQTESRLWLNLINRRIGGRLRIRNPYYAEIKRDLPYDAFRAMELSIKTSGLENFRQPHCDIAGNRKGTVIAFTSEKGVSQLFTMLSGKKEENVKKYFRRSLKRRGRAKLIVNSEKDFALIYKLNKGQLIVGFHFGVWNINGFPQHT